MRFIAMITVSLLAMPISTGNAQDTLKLLSVTGTRCHSGECRYQINYETNARTNLMVCKIFDKNGKFLKIIERAVRAPFGAAPFWLSRSAGAGRVVCALQR